jgi:hypothetical protein
MMKRLAGGGRDVQDTLTPIIMSKGRYVFEEFAIGLTIKKGMQDASYHSV